MGEPTIYSISQTHEHWPALLREIPSKASPKSLFVKGVLPPPDTLVVAIVGTRTPSSYGKDVAVDIVRSLARNRIAIASGMALGIDSIAHKTALEEGIPTIAVLGCGLSEKVLYPKENVLLSRRIAEEGGAVISEYNPDQKPELWTFPQRNRIIAGIAKAVIVIEAGEKSGALITARHAAEYSRDVLAVPGTLYNSMARGTNNLIKEGATPITSPDDILEVLGLEQKNTSTTSVVLSPDEHTIIEALHEELAFDDIIRATGLPAHVVLTTTASLEIRGIIKTTSSGTYRKI